MVYTMYIQPLGIYMVYTWYIPTIYLIGVPDAGSGCTAALAGRGLHRRRISGWNPYHLDRIWQIGTYVSEEGTYMFKHFHVVMNVYVHGMYMYIH